MKRIIKTKGLAPLSYCQCTVLCSGITADHVVPKKILKEQLPAKAYKKAINDGHNLYPTCRKSNQFKAAKLLGKDWMPPEPQQAHLARAALYMVDQYGIDFEDELLDKYNFMNQKDDPWEFERKRSAVIKHHQGNGNPFIDNYPDRILLTNFY